MKLSLHSVCNCKIFRCLKERRYRRGQLSHCSVRTGQNLEIEPKAKWKFAFSKGSNIECGNTLLITIDIFEGSVSI